MRTSGGTSARLRLGRSRTTLLPGRLRRRCGVTVERGEQPPHVGGRHAVALGGGQQIAQRGDDRLAVPSRARAVRRAPPAGRGDRDAAAATAGLSNRRGCASAVAVAATNAAGVVPASVAAHHVNPRSHVAPAGRDRGTRPPKATSATALNTTSRVNGSASKRSRSVSTKPALAAAPVSRCATSARTGRERCSHDQA